MDAIAFDPGFVGRKAAPPRTSSDGASIFDDFLPQESKTPAAPANEPERSDPKRPSTTAEQAETRRPRTKQSDEQSDDSIAAAASISTPAGGPVDPAAAATATDTATADIAATGILDGTPAEPTPPRADAAAKAALPPGATANATPAPAQIAPAEASADEAAADMPLPKPTPAEAMPKMDPAQADEATQVLQTIPPKAALRGEGVPAPGKFGPTAGISAGPAAQQTGVTARSTTGGTGTEIHAGARNAPSAQAPQAGAPDAAAPPPGPAAASAQIKPPAVQSDISSQASDSPDTLLSASAGDGDPASGPASQSLVGTPSAPAPQAAHGAMSAGGYRPVAMPPMLAEQIAVHIHRGVQQGADRIDIQLSPAELGRIEVRLELGHDGRVHAAIAADRPDTLDLLQRDARGLERALQDAGLKTDSGGLSFNLRDNGRQQSQAGFTASQPFADNRSERSEPGVLADAGGHRIRLDGVVDIRV